MLKCLNCKNVTCLLKNVTHKKLIEINIYIIPLQMIS